MSRQETGANFLCIDPPELWSAAQTAHISAENSHRASNLWTGLDTSYLFRIGHEFRPQKDGVFALQALRADPFWWRFDRHTRPWGCGWGVSFPFSCDLRFFAPLAMTGFPYAGFGAGRSQTYFTALFLQRLPETIEPQEKCAVSLGCGGCRLLPVYADPRARSPSRRNSTAPLGL